MTARFAGATLFLVVLALSPAHSEDGDADSGSRFARNGLHLSAGGGWALNQFEKRWRTTLPAEVHSPTGGASGYTLRLGGRISPHFGAEVQFENFREFSVDVLGYSVEDEVRIASQHRLDTYTFFAAGRFFLLTGRVQPYLVVGLGGIVASSPAYPAQRDQGQKFVPLSQRSGFAARFGAGVDVYITENWFVGAEAAEVITTNVGGLDHISFVGVAGYRF